jgi:mannose-6-phosphate isomerase-like protein (cupin superfamily)
VRLGRVTDQAKGWIAGPWNGIPDASVAVASEGVDEPHVHTRVTEIYLIARGSSSVRVESETVELEAGDVLIVELGEAHTFLGSSPDYLHFVVHAPGVSGEEAQREKEQVPRARLGL